MKKGILGFCLFFIFTAYAQENEVHLISLANDKNTAIDSDFYIENVYDGRQIKENIGTVYVSLFNNKVSANFQKPFTEELASLFAVLYPKKENKKAVSVRINELYVTETNNTNENNKELGSATVVLDIIEKGSDGKDYIVGTYFSNREDTRTDVTKLHPVLITAAIKNTFENYKNSKQVYKEPIPFFQEEPVDVNNTQIKAGVYLNYKDVFNQHSLSLDDYTITKYKEGFCLLNKTTGRVETGFYGFSDGQHFYINLFQFSTVRYYLKTELLGANYFIDEVVENNLDIKGYYATYAGLIGGAGGVLVMTLINGGGGSSSSEINTIPLIIERVSGAPTFLTDKYVLQMLEPNKTLLKEYKKTKRTPADKKMFYKKSNNL
ncbi:hypothetical protein [Flavobacterium sp. XGLA_31]|uniref:hypothetical protein n=1 Tax=Flavobacterium sp. XGLA_31 TaxID=3447666 RepID=UPI003F3327F9